MPQHNFEDFIFMETATWFSATSRTRVLFYLCLLRLTSVRTQVLLNSCLCWGTCLLGIFSLGFVSIATHSSVARGGGGAPAPHWPVKYAKSRVFGAFEADFWWKNENSPPKEIGCRSCEVDVVIRPEKSFEFWPENPSQFRWRPFFIRDYLFWAEKAFEFPILAEISVSILRINRINRVILIQEQWKFGSRSFAVFSLFQKSPPLFQILATHLTTHVI